MPAPRLIRLALLLAGVASCDVVRGSGPDFSHAGFSVRAASGHIVLENRSSAPVHYVVLEEETSARVDPYFDPRAWPSIQPGEKRGIPLGELMGYTPDARQARVYWWTRDRYGEQVVVRLR